MGENGNGEDEDDPIPKDDGAIAQQLDQNHKGKEVVNHVSSPENRENDPIPIDDGAIAVRMDKEQKGKDLVAVEDSPEISVNDSTSEKHNSGEKSKFKHYLESCNGYYFCKICIKPVCKTSTNNYARHIRIQHPKLCTKIVLSASWAPELVEELVRLAGESVCRNKGYISHGKTPINWKFVANELNSSTECKLSPEQIRNKWNHLVRRLPKNADKSESIETNAYVFLVISSSFICFMTCR